MAPLMPQFTTIVIFMENYEDQDFSFLDSTIFVIANRRGVKEVFGFDDHFKTMGLILMPAKTK